MSSLLLTDTGARRGRARVSRGGRRVVVPLAEYRAASRHGSATPAGDHADGAGHTAPTGYTEAERAGAEHAGAEYVEYAEAESAVVGRAGRVRRAGAVAPSGEAPLRLTRRGRLVVRLLAGAALLLVVAVGVLGDRTALAGPETSDTPVLERVVLPGETLWSIAGEVAPEVDRRDTVAQIIELNDLPSAGVTAGQRLAVPASTR